MEISHPPHLTGARAYRPAPWKRSALTALCVAMYAAVLPPCFTTAGDPRREAMRQIARLASEKWEADLNASSTFFADTNDADANAELSDEDLFDAAFEAAPSAPSAKKSVNEFDSTMPEPSRVSEESVPAKRGWFSTSPAQKKEGCRLRSVGYVTQRRQCLRTSLNDVSVPYVTQ